MFFKIGYLNHNEEQLLSKYLDIYDVVIMGDPDMTFVDTVTEAYVFLRGYSHVSI